MMRQRNSFGTKIPYTLSQSVVLVAATALSACGRNEDETKKQDEIHRVRVRPAYEVVYDGKSGNLNFQAQFHDITPEGPVVRLASADNVLLNGEPMRPEEDNSVCGVNICYVATKPASESAASQEYMFTYIDAQGNEFKETVKPLSPVAMNFDISNVVIDLSESFTVKWKPFNPEESEKIHLNIQSGDASPKSIELSHEAAKAGSYSISASQLQGLQPVQTGGIWIERVIQGKDLNNPPLSGGSVDLRAISDPLNVALVP